MVAADAEVENIFAIVNGDRIKLETYESLLSGEARNKFFHFKPPEVEIMRFRREIGDLMVNSKLMLAEAKRRGLEPDLTAVEDDFKKLAWGEGVDSENEEVIRQNLIDRDLISQLETLLHKESDPSEAELRAYYQENLNKFTTPPQSRPAIILFKISRWETSDVWEAGKIRAGVVYEELKSGADFSEMAREYSDDFTAENGGDMGYQHEGMMGDAVQVALDKLNVGEVGEPVMLLEGWAILKLIGRTQPEINPFEKVKERVESLWRRDAKEVSFKSRIARLRENANIQFVDKKYLLLLDELKKIEESEKALKESKGEQFVIVE